MLQKVFEELEKTDKVLLEQLHLTFRESDHDHDEHQKHKHSSLSSDRYEAKTKNETVDSGFSSWIQRKQMSD